MKTINNKTYFKDVEGNWKGYRKDGVEYKISDKGILAKLNDDGLQGVGDVIKKLTNAVGIKTCSECEDRRKKLNSLFPFSRKKELKEITETDKQLLDRVTSKKLIASDDADALFKLYNKVFSDKIKRCNCPGLVRTIIERLVAARDVQEVKE